MAIIKSSVKLGTATNLILGYNPQWNPCSIDKQGLFIQKEKPLKEIDIDIFPDATAKWSYPEISLHDNTEDLLNAVFPFRIGNPQDGKPDAEVGAGSMLLNDSDKKTAYEDLSKLLGIDLSVKDNSYALVQLNRIVATAYHESNKNGLVMHPNPMTPSVELGVQDAFRKSLIKVRAPEGDNPHFEPSELNLKQASICMDHFNEWGTHFVSSAIVGDSIFQVFAYDKVSFSKVKSSFSKNNYTNENAVNFCLFTTNAVTGKYGYVQQYGKLVSYANNAQMNSDETNKLWLDETWSEINSIFAPFLENSTLTSIDLNDKYKENAVIRFQLTNLSIFAEFDRRQSMKRVLRGALIQKFTKDVKPHFEKYFPYDINKVIPNSEIPGFLSTLVTTDINTYKTKLSLDEIQLVAADKAKTFALCSQYLSSEATTTHLPGNMVNILSQSANFETDEGVVVLTLNKAAYKSLKFNVKFFYGGLVVSRDDFSEHFTLVDGLKYTYGTIAEEGRYLVKIEDDIRSNPPAETILPVMSNNLSFAYTFAESILEGCGDNTDPDQKPAHDFATNTMLWIAAILPGNSKDSDIIDLRVRALDSARNAMNPAYGAYVPLLPAEMYEKQVKNILQYSDAIALEIQRNQSIVDQRKQEELIINVGKDLNQNIIDSGQLLLKFIQVSASQQSDLNSYYQAIINQKQVELKSASTKIDSIQKNVNSQKSVVETAVNNYKQAVKDWETRQAIQFGLDMATTIFSAITSFAIPASSINAVKDLGLSVQRIQKLLNILNSSYKVYTVGKAGIDQLKNAENALEDLNDAVFNIESNLAWDEMNANMTLLLNTGPTIQAKNELQNAFQILLLRGKALLGAKDAANQLAKDIYNQQRLNALSDAQQKRLDELKNQLTQKNLPDLDPLKIDLIGMTGSLQFVQSRMLETLSKTFLLQDQSLQYENLQKATLITSFDLLNFKGAIVKQGQNTINALTLLNAIQKSTTAPIKISFKVPASSMTGGNEFLLNLGLENSLFFEYIDCRIQSVVASVNTTVKTDQGKYLLKLAYDGEPFLDRAPGRIPRSFRTPGRERIYEFQTEGNIPNFTDNGISWSKGVTPVTPFSAWYISFPKTELNKGLVLGDVIVDVTLEFILEARIEDEAKEMFMSRKRMRSANLVSAINRPSIEDLTQSMLGRTVTNGWDVVFNMTLDKIQNAINAQYDKLKTNTSYGGKINTEYSYQVSSHVKGWTKLDVQYGYPKMTFLPNDPTNVNLDIQILSGTITKGSQYDNNPIEWDSPVASNPGASITALIPLSKVQGIVNSTTGESKNVFSVVLDMAQGTFQAKDMAIEGDDDKAAFSAALTNYFTQNKVVFIINSLDLSQITTLDDLRPNQFVFKTLITRTYSNQILQLFITTGNRVALSYSQAFINNLDEPIPMGSDCSMIINSKVFFNNVLPQSLNKQGWHLVGIDPKDITKAWSAQFDQGSLSAPVDLSALNNSYTSPGEFPVTTFYTYSIPGGVITENIQGMSLTPKGANVSLDFSKQQTQKFNEHWEQTTIFNNSGDRTLSSDYTLNITANMPLTISGSDRNQRVSFAINNQDINIGGHLSGGGPCGCGDDLQAQFNTQLKNQIPGKVVSQMNVTFTDISVFALKNLLFPEDNFIDLTTVNCPGDALIVGVFK